MEDPKGGVLLIGGFDLDKNEAVDSIYKLASSQDTEWVKLPQTLETPRTGHTAFFVPHNVAYCGI